MVVNGRPLKRARARVEAKDFAGFPGAGNCGAAGTFREAVRGFLAKHARLRPVPSIFSPAAAAAPPHLLIWRVSLAVGEEAEDGGGGRVELNVVEEDVLRSRSVYCDQCRVVGEFLSSPFLFLYSFWKIVSQIFLLIFIRGVRGVG
jgi:hypothetical protein